MLIMARKTDDIGDFLLKDIQKEEDVLEIANYFEESNYKLEDLEDVLTKVLLLYMKNKYGRYKVKKRNLN